MRDLADYLRDYRAYISATLGWGAVMKLGAVWLAGMCIPLAVKTWVPLPTWGAAIWMIAWALLGYVFGPYGLWKHQRTLKRNIVGGGVE
jgi:hypothetical protein